MPQFGDRSRSPIALSLPCPSRAGTLAFGHIVGLLILIAALFLASPSFAEPADITASEQDGYGRIVLTFDDPPQAETKMAGGVLVISFSKPVETQVATIARGLSGFVTVARRDPDGRAIRLALSRPVKVNTIAAGEKLFVDVMPDNWVGMPPALPPDVVAELTKRALEVERIRKELARAQTLPPAAMTLTSGSNDERIRLTFSFSDRVDVRFRHDGRHGVLTVPAKIVFDAAMARAELPPEITDFSASATGDALTVRFTAPDGEEMRGFAESDAYVVDIARPEKLKPFAVAPSREIPVPAAPPQQSAEITEIEGSVDAGAGDHAANAPPERAAAIEAAQPHIPPHIAAERAPPPEKRKEAAVAPPSAGPGGGLRDLAEAATEGGVQVRTGDDKSLNIAFPFKEIPAAAAFARGSSVFAVFDGGLDIDAERLGREASGVVSRVRTLQTGAGTAVEFVLAQPRLISLTRADNTWVLTLGETILESMQAIQFTPSFTSDGRTSLHASIEGVGAVHRVPDGNVGDDVLVVTLKPPARGTSREREFVEFRALQTAQGLAFEPLADDLSVRAAPNEVMLTRDEGLTISLDAAQPREKPAELSPGSPFAPEAWREARRAPAETGSELARLAAASTPAERTKARLRLARFHLANGDAAETKAILNVATADSPALADDPAVKLLRGAALVMLRQFEGAARELGSGTLANDEEASLWRMIAEAGLGRVALARESFRKGEPVLPALPEELQRTFRQAMMEVAVAAKDFATAAVQLDALDKLNLAEGWAMREVMRGRIAEGLDQPALALEAYRHAMESDDEPAKAEARLYATNLRYRTNEVARAQAVRDLESLTTYWRGDHTEALALARLAGLYTEDKRWRDAFTTMRTAVDYHPDEPSTRDLQEKMTAEFARLFLDEDVAPPTLESVALFYDFKELTPPGRKGDELIRKLADRLVEVDLLTQAADLLTYQIRNRLQGAARAQVAAHAAAIELMNRKPGRALNLLHETRLAGLPSDLVRSRLILEARALSELQRPDLALEMVAAFSGGDVDRLRADINWAAQRWQPAAEDLELMLGEVWKKTEPLDEAERVDVLRAAIAYALSDDSLGLGRLRAKYNAKLASTPEQRAFDIITLPDETRGRDFAEVAKEISAADTLTSFLEDYRQRYPKIAPPVVRAKGGEPTADARG